MKAILFIDDDDDFREAITSILENAGFKVVALKGSEKLDETLKKNKFNIAVVDYFLPMENGIEIAGRIATSKYGQSIKILMVSSHDNIKPIIAKAGIKHFLSKPLEPEELIKKIDSLL